MTRIQRVLGAAAVAAVALSTQAAAQDRSIIGPQALDAAVAAQAPNDRAVVTAFLASESTRQAARAMGVNAADLTAGVAALDDARLAPIAQRITADDSALAGGDRTVVITTTTLLIVALLVIILVSV